MSGACRHLPVPLQRSNGSAKGDWDVGIALDAMKAAPAVGRLVLVSGDGDFIPIDSSLLR